MTYADISEIKAFNDLIQVKRLSAGQIALWYALLHINNKCPLNEWFTVANLTLQLQTGLSRNGINKARNSLKQYGIIDFKQNGTKATIYKINTMSKSSQDSGQIGGQISSQDGGQDSSQISSTLNKLNKTKLNIKKESKREDVRSFNEIIDTYTQNETLRKELKEHLKTRKAKKATLTNRAIELECSALDKLASDDTKKIEIVRQSIANGWTGFFPLKENFSNTNNAISDGEKQKERERQMQMLKEKIDRGEL